MDFSNCNLISFGDSFTFGQGTEGDGISFMEYINKHNDIDRAIATEKWITLSNARSYTTRLSKLLKFKKTINLGQMGASNHHTLYYLREFIAKNHHKNNVYLINLTEPARHLSMQARTVKQKYTEPENYLYLETLRIDYMERWKNNKALFTNDFYKLNGSFWNNYFSNFKTSEDVLYNHIQTYYSICELLKGKKYFIFDIMNDIDFELNRIKLPKIYSSHISISKFTDNNLIKNNFEPIFNSNNFIEDYTEHVKNNKNYLNFYELNKRFESNRPYKNLNSLIGKNSIYTAKFDSHWNVTGHNKVAKVLQDFITERS